MSWSPGITLAAQEQETILAALRFYGGNRTHAAEALGIALRTLTTKLAGYEKAGIAVPQPARPGPQQGVGPAPNGHDHAPPTRR